MQAEGELIFKKSDNNSLTLLPIAASRLHPLPCNPKACSLMPSRG